MKNHTELLLATPSMCQSRDLLIHVLIRSYTVRNIINFYVHLYMKFNTRVVTEVPDLIYR